MGLQSLSIIDKEAFIFIIDEIFDKIERENIARKIEYFKHYFMNTLKNPACEANFDERRFFLDALGSMGLLECDILGYLSKQNNLIKVEMVQKEGVEQYAVIGAINRLVSYGFLSSSNLGIGVDDLGADVDFNLKGSVRITLFGKRFVDFCFESKSIYSSQED